tara:strand:+ start:58676 stop:59395 length:720 start_codon:yes stop_codon:yes gene_type:complete
MSADKKQARVDAAKDRPESSRRAALEFLRSAYRIRLFGVLVCVGLIAATAWVWLHPEVVVGSDRVDRAKMADAIELLEQAADWRADYVACTNERDALQRRIETISRWLPQSVDWTQVNDQVRRAGFDTRVEVVQLRQLENHVGERVGVLIAECQVKGRFNSIYEFIHRISTAQDYTASDNDPGSTAAHLPVWCQSVRLQRVPDVVDGEVQCVATVMMRVPYAAEGTAAARLFAKDLTDA